MNTKHMSTYQDVAIELEPPPPPRGRGRTHHTTFANIHRTHSRSASWSLPGPGGHGSRASMSLAALNPMTPIANVIREIVPSFGQSSDSSTGVSPHVSRNPSQTSLLLGSPEVEESNPEQESIGLVNSHVSMRTMGDTSSSLSVHLPHEHVSLASPPPPAAGGGGATGSLDDQNNNNVGLELSDSMRWLEHNAIFIILLLIKFAWYHRSGMCHHVCASVLLCVCLLC